MKGIFILRGCSRLNDKTSFLMFSVDRSWLHLSRLIFINARELSLDSVMVARRAVLISFSWLKLLSLSHDVMGSVKASVNSAFKFGYVSTLHSLRASTSVSGTVVDGLSFHVRTHESYSILHIIA